MTFGLEVEGLGVVSARQLKRRVRATGGAGHNAYTKEATGVTRLNERRGPVDSNSTGPFRRRRTAFTRAVTGDCYLSREGSQQQGVITMK